MDQISSSGFGGTGEFEGLTLGSDVRIHPTESALSALMLLSIGANRGRRYFQHCGWRGYPATRHYRAIVTSKPAR
jgi:hypothetical protein